MKNPKFERNRRLMKQYHRNNPWPLENGIRVYHRYLEPRPKLSYWDDTGFILNKRHVVVAWTHPRYVYHSQIEELAWQEVGDLPDTTPEVFTKNWRKVGRSRKKVDTYTLEPSSVSTEAYFARFRDVLKKLESEGIDYQVLPSIKIETLASCTYVSLCCPLEVINQQDLISIAQLAKRLVKRETTIEQTFPNYRYTRNDWLAEAPLREQDLKMGLAYDEQVIA